MIECKTFDGRHSLCLLRYNKSITNSFYNRNMKTVLMPTPNFKFLSLNLLKETDKICKIIGTEFVSKTVLIKSAMIKSEGKASFIPTIGFGHQKYYLANTGAARRTVISSTK